MPKHRTFEEYFFETIQGVKVETDFIEYSIYGIEKWSVWSSIYQDWIECSIYKMQVAWPGKFEELENKLIRKAQDIIADSQHEYEPEMEVK